MTASFPTVLRRSFSTQKETIQRGVSNFSFELTPAFAQKLFVPEAERTEKQEQLLDSLRSLGKTSGAKTKVYVTKLPGHPQEDTINAVRAVHQFADHLEAVPHLPTRGIRDNADLAHFIERMTTKAGDFRPVEHVLVVGGSVDTPVGQFSESLQLLETGVLQENGIKTIGMAAHPQGADNIEQSVLEKAFEDKLRWAQAQKSDVRKLDFDWSTQLAYSPQAIIQWEKDLRHGKYGKTNASLCNDLPIRLGIPGPASMAQLAKYAQMSGIGNSINYFKNNPLAAWNLMTKRSVLDDLVVEISEYMQKEGT